LLVVFSRQGATAESTVLHAAVLNTAQPGTVASFAIAGSSSLSQREPSAVRTGDRVYLAWRSDAASGNVNAEELWLKELSWTVAGSTLTLDLSRPEIPLPRTAANQAGDQRTPILGTASLWPSGALVAVWEDYGVNFGVSAGQPDVAVQFIPLPILRSSGGGGG
jgi:hypothetical protein